MTSSLLSHPINPVLLLCLLYALQRILFPIIGVPRTPATECKAGYSWMPRRHTPTLRFTTYTPRTLAKFNGHDGGRTLFAIAGFVFDVTGGKGFYGPGEHLVTFFRISRAKGVGGEGGGKETDGFIQDGMYWRVAGRDASRSVAKQSFDLGTPPFLSLARSKRYRLLTLLVMPRIEPLTPIDEPLDKLEDLTPRERSVLVLCPSRVWLMLVSLTSENMRGWTEHFANRYIICGRLVDNDAAES